MLALFLVALLLASPQFLPMLNNALVRALIQEGVATGQYPSTLYKYRSFDARTEDIFKNDQLWFSQAKAFNDPFDCQIHQSEPYSPADIESYLLTRAGLAPNTASQLATGYARDPRQFRKLLEEVKERVLGTKGILCLSRPHDHILMWSHYCTGHTGFVLGFSLLADVSFFCTPFNVLYVDNYPNFNYLTEPDKILNHGMLSKSTLWAYEQEVRILKNTAGPHQFAKQCLTEVLLGAKMSDADKTSLLGYLKTYGYTHVKVKQAVVSHSRYALDFTTMP
jgi:hypothetical protein